MVCAAVGTAGRQHGLGATILNNTGKM